MEVYLKKYFWVLNFVVVIACAVFAAKATNHLIEAEYLGEATSHGPAAARQRPRKVKPPVEQRSKDGELFAKRNMFCSTCEPAEPVVETPSNEPASDTPPATALPLELVATNVANEDAYSFATIRNSTSRMVGAYKTGQEIPTAGPIEKIRGRYVDFRNTQNNRVERLSLGVAVEPRDRPTVAMDRPVPPPSTEPRDELTAALDEGIKKIDENNYEISRSLVEKVLANPVAIRGARIVPSIKNGKANGFKLYAIRPNSAFARIGLQNGDTIHAVNGFDLTTPDKALEVYTKVRESSNLSVSVTRRGNPVTLNYSIR